MTTRFRTLLLLAAPLVVFMSLSPSILKETSSQTRIGNKANVFVDKFAGLCYGPHRDNEDPDLGIQPTISELSEDLAFIKNLTNSIRTYGATDNLEQIPILCQQFGIDCYPGAWLSKYPCENERQIDNLIEIAQKNLSHVKGLIVGNEVLLRNDLSEQKLIEFISRVKNSTNLPVATAEIWKDWLDHPQLAQAVDILFVHIYPYWDGVAVEKGANYILEKWNELKTKYPDKKMVIGETGWPSQGAIRGDAIPSEENQKKYFSDFIAMADSNNIDYFYFEIFDETWKAKGEGVVGGHWGLYYSNGSIKPLFVNCVPESARNGITRPPRVVTPVERVLSLYVYADACDPRNGFYSSGWMGDLAKLCKNDTNCVQPNEILDEAYTINPYSGKSCIRISYIPCYNPHNPPCEGWGGIYWQFPVNNWGKYPGYDLSKSLPKGAIVKIKFHVRGEKGGEKAEFKTGGINDFTLPYRDSYGPITTTPRVKTLSTAWEADSFMVKGDQLSMVIGGFVWVTNNVQNPQGSTIYLDEIVFEIMLPTGVENKEHLTPTEFALNQNYPNPFNPSTTIGYQLKVSAEIDISVYNLDGQKVVTLIHQNQLAGTYHIKWNGYDSNGQPVSNGIYIYKFTVNKSLVDSRKMILLK